MATATIRGVVVAAASHHYLCKEENTQNSVAPFSVREEKPFDEQQRTESESGDFSSFSTCTCNACIQQTKFKTCSPRNWQLEQHTSTTADLSSSQTVADDRKDLVCKFYSEQQQVHKRTEVYKINSRASLGQLQRKQSPIFTRTPSRFRFSLRAKQPSYAPQKLFVDQDEILFQKTEKNKSSVIDQTAIEAINMQKSVTSTNGGQQQRSRSSGIIDINRNNGVNRNGTILTSSSVEKREHLYKILVIGELGTGKTSFIKRYVHQFFSQNYRATIGVDFALKVLHWDANTIVRLQLWDIAGQERFGNMTRVYYKEAVGAFIVFDVTRSGTFDCVSKWKEDLDSKVQLPDGTPIPCILLANKCDQEKQGMVTTPDKMDEYVQENGFAGWFETSAKENINIDEAARALVNKILHNDKLISDADLADSEKLNLNSTGDQTGADESKCSC